MLDGPNDGWMPPRDLNDVLTKIVAVLDASPMAGSGLRSATAEIIAGHTRLLYEVPETRNVAWESAQRIMIPVMGAPGSTPVRLAHADRWRAEILAIWRDTTVEALEASGLVTIEPPPPPAPEWITALRGFCELRGLAYRGKDKDVNLGGYIGCITGGGLVHVHVEVHVNMDRTLRYEPLMHEATGRDNASASQAAFAKSCALADALTAELPLTVPEAAFDPDDVPF